MGHPYGEQYGQEGNPRAYMTMRDYRNLPYQWGNQQPIGRNPNPPRSMREYRDQWMSAPVYSVPSTYPPPPHPQYASLSQPQPSQPISLVEQAILDLTKLVGDAVVEQKEFNAQLNEKIHTEENSLDQSLDGLNNDFEHDWDTLQYSIEDLVDLQLCQPEEESQEDECLTETILVEQAQLQPQEELEVELVQAPEDLQDAPVNFWPWTNEEQNTALLTEKSSGHEGTQEPIIQPNTIDLDTTATSQDTKYPLPVAPSVDQVYILPSPAPQPTPATKSKPTTPAANSKHVAPKAKSNPLPAAPPDSVFILPMPAAQPKPQASTTKATPSLLVLQNIGRLVASVHAFATTSKKMENAYIAWHSGWFGCGFGFGTLGPRHF